MAIKLPKEVKHEYIIMLLGMCDFMPATDRAAYDQNDVESDVVAYIIEISMKIWDRQYVVYVVLGVAGPIVLWFVDRSSWRRCFLLVCDA